MKGDVFYRYDLKRQIKKHARDGLIVDEGNVRSTIHENPQSQPDKIRRAQKHENKCRDASGYSGIISVGGGIFDG